jgi:hypothetical protein
MLDNYCLPKLIIGPLLKTLNCTVNVDLEGIVPVGPTVPGSKLMSWLIKSILSADATM